MNGSRATGWPAAVGLFFLAPWVGEWLLGNAPITELYTLPLMGLLYGSGAILIREVTRRSGRGWPTMFILGLAYGLLEAGLWDQTLFNPSMMDHTPAGPVTYVPLLGLSVSNAMAFVVGHTVWSIGVPIALVEAMVPARRDTPWLSLPGLAVTAVLYFVGAGVVFESMQDEEAFIAPVPRLVGVSVAVLALISLAFVGWRPRPSVERRAPAPWLVGVVCFIASGLFFTVPASWWGVAYGFGLVTAMVVLLGWWSRQEGWGAAHRFALAAGALLTYAWGGFRLTVQLYGRHPELHDQRFVTLAGNALFAAVAIALLVAAARIVGKEPEPSDH